MNIQYSLCDLIVKLIFDMDTCYYFDIHLILFDIHLILFDIHLILFDIHVIVLIHVC